jgi:hypothetical protein
MADETVQAKPQTDDEVVKVASLADIPDSSREARTPDPIVLMWKANGKDMLLEVETRYPEDPDGFPLLYVMEAERSRTPEVGRDGKETFPHEGCHDDLLRQSCISSPTWLKNPSAFRQFKEKVPPTIVAKLHRDLRNVGGLTADFFESNRRWVQPAILQMLSSTSAPTSASSQQKSAPPTPTPATETPNSPPSGSASVASVSNNVPPASSTTSGRAPPPAPSVMAR